MKLVTVKEMQEMDRRATHEFGISSLTLMENAGRGVAEIAEEIMEKSQGPILVLAGKGNNGGDGLVATRCLIERGFRVTVLLFCDPSELKDDPAVNFKKLTALNISIRIVRHSEDPERSEGDEESKKQILRCAQDDVQDANLIIDALFGIGLKKALGEPYVSVIQTVNGSGRKVLAVDIPSGLDADTGEVLGVAVKATVTATLGLPKKGLYLKKGPEYSGAIRVVDIGIPRVILSEAKDP